MKPKSKILIIAGSDSSGGAGIQADIKTITALGSYAMTAITAVTSQNTTGVKSIVAINPKEILNQIIFTSKDIKPDAIKIGMLHSSKVIDSVIKSLDNIKIKNIVLDPVMVAKGGAKLIDNKAIMSLKSKLINRVTLITPNIPEAEILANQKIFSKEDMITAGKKLLNLHKIYDPALLTELIKFNHHGNFDRVMAFMIGMYHTRELYNAEVKDILEDRSADKWFDRNYY